MKKKWAALAAVGAGLLVLHTVQHFWLAGDMSRMREEIDRLAGNVRDNGVQIQNAVSGIQALEEELRQSQSLFLETEASVSYEDGRLVVAMKGVPKTAEAGARLIAGVQAGEKEYRQETDENGCATLSIEPSAASLRPFFRIETEKESRREFLDSLWVDEELKLSFNAHWDEEDLTQMSVKVLLPGEDSWLKGEDVTGGTFILVKNGEYGETSQETNESAGSAMGYAARPGMDAAVPERAVPDGIRLPAKRTTAGETAVISFWGDFGEYAKQKDGVEYDVYFVMETAQGLTFVSAPDPLGEFCYGEDSSSVGTSGGGLYPVF